jgi:hypothetical protein
MATDYIRYDILAQAALRGVVRTVLADVAKKGLPGEHHFKITFATVAPGVRLSERMRGQYPDAMTIVLQHQFWDLEITEHGFSVTLSFQKQLDRLVIPFAAIRSFADPSVNFALEFAVPEAKPAAGPATSSTVPVLVEAPPSKPAKKSTGDVVALDSFRKR